MWQRTCTRLGLFALLALFAFLSFSAIPTASAQVSVDSTGLTATGDAVWGALDPGENIGTYVGTRIVQPLLAIVGTLFLLLIIYAGLLWMTAGGVTARVEKAKNILVHSVVGLVIIVAAYSVTIFILESVT